VKALYSFSSTKHFPSHSECLNSLQNICLRYDPLKFWPTFFVVTAGGSEFLQHGLFPNIEAESGYTVRQQEHISWHILMHQTFVS
jgi:hypothetical protein